MHERLTSVLTYTEERPMLRHIDRITWRNGWHLNGLPAHVAEIRPIFDGRVAAARSVWEKYEEEKAKLREQKSLWRCL